MDRKLLYFKKKFEAAGKRQGWTESTALLAAVSGGGDSVALLWLLKNFYGGKISVAHLDHCTRNGAAHEDAAFVAALCKKWDVPCFVKRVNVEEEKQTGESFEMTARRIRYEFFEDVAEAEKADFIALGHNMDDLVETQLLNLFRGAGIDGLCGIPEVRGKIVRPLIDFRREELREILKENGIEWREDSTNTENLYKRNKIRNELVPWIKVNLNDNFEISMAGLARQTLEIKTERNRQAQRLLEEISFEHAPLFCAWRKNAADGISDASLAELLRMQGKKLNLPVLDRKRTEELIRLIRSEGRWRFQWALDVEVCRTKDGIFWGRRKDTEMLKN